MTPPKCTKPGAIWLRSALSIYSILLEEASSVPLLILCFTIIRPLSWINRVIDMYSMCTVSLFNTHWHSRETSMMARKGELWIIFLGILGVMKYLLTSIRGASVTLQLVAHFYNLLHTFTICCTLLQFAAHFYNLFHTFTICSTLWQLAPHFTICSPLLQFAPHFYNLLHTFTIFSTHYNLLPAFTICSTLLQFAPHFYNFLHTFTICSTLL